MKHLDNLKDMSTEEVVSILDNSIIIHPGPVNDEEIKYDIN